MTTIAAGFRANRLTNCSSFWPKTTSAGPPPAPAIMGNPDRPELGTRLENSFCRTDPDIARDFARATFLSDNRSDLPSVGARTLVLQCSEDIIAPLSVGEYVHAALPRSQFRLLRATGHCPNLSAPDEVTAAIREFV